MIERLKKMFEFKVSLTAARVNAGFTLKEAAKLLKVSERTISRWESGKASPSVDHFVGLCRLYGCSVDAIKTFA